MNENNANFTPAAPNFKTLVRMSFQGLTNFPYIEEDFDALTNYGLLSKVVEYLNEVISNNNEQNDLMTGLYNAYVSLQNYVNDYFDNLDVQDEINNKLDAMAEDGSLTTLIGSYIDPLITQQNQRINTIETKVDAATSGSPLVASSTAGMTDTTRVYVNTTDGKWYYYDGDSWEIGGTYQSTGIASNSIDYNELATNLQNSVGIRELDITWTEGSGYMANNSTISNVNVMHSNIIEVKKGETLRIKGVGYNTSLGLIVSCDSNGDDINCIMPVGYTTSAEYEYTFGMDTYIIITIGKTDFEYAYCYSSNTTASNMEYEKYYQNNQTNLITSNDIFNTVSTTYQFNDSDNNNFYKILKATINSNGELKYGYNYNLYKTITLDETTQINKLIVFFDIKNSGESVLPLKLKVLNKSLQAITGRSSTSSKILTLTNDYKRHIYEFDLNVETDGFNLAFGYDVATESSVTGGFDIRLLGYAINTNINVVNNNLYTQKDKNLLIDKTIFNNQTISILGDSYSTYSGWLPDGYNSWYRDTGNVQENNVSDVSQTWWYKLLKDTNNNLLVNCSYNGSTICNTGYNGSDSSATSFVTRMKAWLGEDRKTEPKPDIIFIFGGTNDVWAESPIGELQYSNWTTNDLKEVLPAFCYMLDYIIKWNPGAKIYFITNTGLGTSLTNSIDTACAHYGVKNIKPTNITKTNGHPNQTGMIEIETAVLNNI